MSKTGILNFEEKDYREFESASKELGYKTVNEMVDAAIVHFFKTRVIETEEVTFKVPKKLLAFLKDKRSEDLKEYLNNCLTDTIAADIDGVFGDHICILEEYDLGKEFKFYQGH